MTIKQYLKARLFPVRFKSEKKEIFLTTYAYAGELELSTFSEPVDASDQLKKIQLEQKVSWTVKWLKRAENKQNMFFREEFKNKLKILLYYVWYKIVDYFKSLKKNLLFT